MNSKDTYDRFNELLKDNKIRCTQTELDEFLMCGLLFDVGKKYITRNQQQVSVDVVKTKTYNFDMNFNDIISICEELSKKYNNNKVYCMSERCYNKYKEQGLIITYNNQDYYRLFEKEKWLVYIIK